jgi:hypothetical protein
MPPRSRCIKTSIANRARASPVPPPAQPRAYPREPGQSLQTALPETISSASTECPWRNK